MVKYGLNLSRLFSAAGVNWSCYMFCRAFRVWMPATGPGQEKSVRGPTLQNFNNVQIFLKL